MHHPLGLGTATVVAALFLSVSVSPVAADTYSKELIDAAKKEGNVVVYHSVNRGVLKKLCATYEKKFGVKTECTRKTTGGVSRMVAAESIAGKLKCDIVSAGDGGLFVAWHKQGLLMPYKSVNYGKFRKETQDPTFASSPARMTYYGIEYSTKQIKKGEEPKDWKDVLDPKWKGKIGVINPDTGGPARLFLSAIVKMYGWEFVEKLAKLKPLMIKSSSTAANMLVQGEVALTIPGSEHSIAKMRAKGQPVDFVYPKSGLMVKDSRVAICKGGKNPNAAKLWIDFETSKEGQGMITKFGAYPPVRADVKMPIERPAGVFDSDKVIGVSEEHLMTKGPAERKKFMRIMKAGANS
ncbi:MAG: extracellular solute-binding protein [Rhodospirillales bacterium]